MYDSTANGFVFATPGYKDFVAGPEECQKECVLHSECYNFVWRVGGGRCSFIKGPYQSTSAFADYVVGPKRCSADTYAP